MPKGVVANFERALEQCGINLTRHVFSNSLCNSSLCNAARCTIIQINNFKDIQYDNVKLAERAFSTIQQHHELQPL